MIDRYTTPELKNIWTEEYKFQKWLDVELATLSAQAELGKISEEIVKEIKKKAKFDINKIKEIEKTTNHDVIAFVQNISETVGENGKFIHFGLTSYDIVDTALAMLMKEAGEIILTELSSLKRVLKKKALEQKDRIIMGRTHSVHAEPTSLGLKFLLWYADTERNINRWKRAIENISYGKISGAIGNYAHIDPEIEKLVCKKLGLNPAPVSTQVIQRDRHSEYLLTLALIATSCEKIALEIRHLQRTEIDELGEPFGKKQKGSSAMPHKKNPIICERICGLSRIVRSNATASLENICLWNERDISNSSIERIIIPDSTILVGYILKKMGKILDNIVIKEDNIKRNIGLTKGIIFSQRVLLELIKKGISRKNAYDIIQKNAFIAQKQAKDFKTILMNDKEIGKYLSTEEIENCFDINYYLRNIDVIYKRVLH